MVNKKLGVLGGMGPEATSVFFERIIKNTRANKDQDHVDMVILNHASLPDRTKAILENEQSRFLKYIKKDIELLEKANVSNIAIPCNTSHYFYEQMQSMTKINIINMVKDTIAYIKNVYGEESKVSVLATNGTIDSGVYEKECKKNNIKLHNPNKRMQQQVMDIIYGIKANTDFNINILKDIINNLIIEENCDCVILGCTELSTVKLDSSMKNYYIDPMDILAKEAISLSNKQLITINKVVTS